MIGPRQGNSAEESSETTSKGCASVAKIHMTTSRRVAAVREAVGSDMQPMVDFNQGLTWLMLCFGAT